MKWTFGGIWGSAWFSIVKLPELANEKRKNKMSFPSQHQVLFNVLPAFLSLSLSSDAGKCGNLTLKKSGQRVYEFEFEAENVLLLCFQLRSSCAKTNLVWWVKIVLFIKPSSGFHLHSVKNYFSSCYKALTKQKPASVYRGGGCIEQWVLIKSIVALQSCCGARPIKRKLIIFAYKRPRQVRPCLKISFARIYVRRRAYMQLMKINNLWRTNTKWLYPVNDKRQQHERKKSCLMSFFRFRVNIASNKNSSLTL